MNVWITLTPEQIAYAAEVARRRHKTNRAVGTTDLIMDEARHGGTVADDKVGCNGEVAVAAWLGTEMPVDDLDQARLKAPDTGGFEVRTRGVRWHLVTFGVMVKDTDPPERKVLAAQCEDLPQVEIIGWLYAGESQREIYRDPYGQRGYRYPYALLRSLSTLSEEARSG